MTIQVPRVVSSVKLSPTCSNDSTKRSTDAPPRRHPSFPNEALRVGGLGRDSRSGTSATDGFEVTDLVLAAGLSIFKTHYFNESLTVLPETLNLSFSSRASHPTAASKRSADRLNSFLIAESDASPFSLR